LHPKKIPFQEEIPLSIDFVDDNKSFLVGTSSRTQYKFELPDLKYKNLLKENEKITCTIWNIRYPLYTKNYHEFIQPVILGGDVKIFLAAGEQGYIFYWRDPNQLESNCGGYLKGHAANISRIQMSVSQDIFLSVGEKDNTVIEWKVDFINDFNNFSKPFQTV
jgi:WD40 repeat protein